MSSTPAPTAVGSPLNLRAERMRRALTVALLALGSVSMRATAPDTTAADMLVPESSMYAPVQFVPQLVTLAGSSAFSAARGDVVATTRLPGARRSGFR